MNILNKIFNFWRWHPEVAIRYLPIVANIKSRVSRIENILELGSGWLGIAPYLDKMVVGVDEDFGGKKFHLLKQVKGNILKVPFADNSFDYVICVDVLEHLTKEQRARALAEILRVAKKEFFIGVPCGRQSYQQDKKLEIKYRKIFDRQFSFLQDHLKFGLPEESEIMQGLNLASKRNHKKITIKIQGNENLQLREFLMKGWMTKNPMIDFIYRKFFLLLIPLFKLFDKPPYYRKLFFVRIES